MEWFKIIAGFKEDRKDVWNTDGSVLIDIKAWKSKEALENHLNKLYEEFSVGTRKGLKKDIVRFINEADEFMMQVGNESFFSSSKDYRDDTILNLAELWLTACKVYFKNKEGKAVYSRFDPNKNLPSINQVIPFGPWIMWGKNEWKDIKYTYKRWKRLQKRSKDMDINTSSSTTFSINQSQRDRGRKDVRSDRSDDADKSKSRSRSRNTASSRRRTISNHKRTSSKSIIIQSSDYADSEASLV